VARDLDAIYTAQLVPWKRHELSLAIPRCGFLFYRDGGVPEAAVEERAIRERHARLAPGHVFINETDGHGLPVRLLPEAVNRQLGRAGVGLCLSEREGAMFASMEYLLAGLAVVTTPSEGGRDVYFDGAYCLTVPPDPGRVAEAVAALTARAIPAAHIRAQTVKRIDAHRRRFLGLLDRILAADGRRAKFGGRWLFDQPVTMRWYPAERAVARVVDGRVDAYSQRRLRYWTAALARAVRRAR
jgi:glycosyltransferase involved in cell wall biosynthesis